MRGLPREGLHAALKTARDESTASAAVVTLAAVPGERHVIRQIDCSWRGANPTVADLIVTIGGEVVWALKTPLLNNKRPSHHEFSHGLYDKDNVNQAVVVTASNLGASSVVKLNVLYE